MNRSLIAVLMVALASTFSAASARGNTLPLCPTTASPDCVLSNWGQTEPEGVDSGMAPRRPESLASGASGKSQMALQLLPVAAPSTGGARQAGEPLKTVVSPVNLFPKETAALTSAIRQARFDSDGAIVSGEERIASAAAAAARAAGTRYTLTLYIKVPQRLKPEESGLLSRKVQSVNQVLANASGGATSSKQ